MKRSLLVICISFLFLISVRAQEVVTGTVVDGKNMPIPGVRVEVVGRTESTVTDIDGNFKLEIDGPAKKLRFSYVGYKPTERKLKSEMLVKLGGGWAAKPSGYRGFFDLIGGFGTGGIRNVESGNSSITGIGKSSIAFGWGLTQGYQINSRFFVGLGWQIQALMFYANRRYDEELYSSHTIYGPLIPVYLDFRWDYDITAKTSPFVDLKLGYQFLGQFDGFDDYYYLRNSSIDLFGDLTRGILIMPTIGMRVSLYRKFGMNIGLSYNISIKRQFTAEKYFYEEYPNGDNVYERVRKDLGKSSGGIGMLNIGFEF